MFERLPSCFLKWPSCLYSSTGIIPLHPVHCTIHFSFNLECKKIVSKSQGGMQSYGPLLSFLKYNEVNMGRKTQPKRDKVEVRWNQNNCFDSYDLFYSWCIAEGKLVKDVSSRLIQAWWRFSEGWKPNKMRWNITKCPKWRGWDWLFNSVFLGTILPHIFRRDSWNKFWVNGFWPLYTHR